MKRREFISLLGVATAWPVMGLAQQEAMPVVGFLSSRSSGEAMHLVAAFRQGLGEAGFVEGRNVVIEFRWAEGQYERLPMLAAELVHRPVAVIAATGGTVTAMVAKRATNVIPIVFTIGGDPIKQGLVGSLSRPGANVTGISQLASEVVAKRLELLQELRQLAGAVALLVNPQNPNAEVDTRDVQSGARTLGLQLKTLSASTEGELETAFTSVAPDHGALLVHADPFFDAQRARIVALAAAYAVPAMYSWRDFPAIGGLMSYGSSISDNYRQTGNYVGRILRGEKPSELPVLQPSKFQFVINLRTAQALHLEIPPKLLALADEVIE